MVLPLETAQRLRQVVLAFAEAIDLVLRSGGSYCLQTTDD